MSVSSWSTSCDIEIETLSNKERIISVSDLEDIEQFAIQIEIDIFHHTSFRQNRCPMVPFAIVNLSIAAVVSVAVLDAQPAVMEAKFDFQTAPFGAPAHNIEVSGGGCFDPGGESPRRTQNTLVSIHADKVVAVEIQGPAEHTINDELWISDDGSMAIISREVLSVVIKGPVTLQTSDSVTCNGTAGKSQYSHHQPTKSLLAHNNPPLQII